jgi:hypothetical protein
MSDVKRYSMRRMGMNLLPDGDYVLHSDYAALEARLAEVGAERERYANNSRKRKLALIEADAEVTRLAALKDALAGDKINLVSELRQVKAELAKAVETLTAIDILDPEDFAHGCSQPALAGLVLRMGELARDTLEELRKD